MTTSRDASCLLILCALFALPTLASAQHLPTACGGNSPTKIFGCMETINGQWTMGTTSPVVRQGEPITVHGWALSCYAKQQPSSWQVFYASAPNATGHRVLVEVPTSAYRIALRGARPDVTPYFRSCDATSDLWGYALQIDGGILPADAENILIVRFTDPSLVGNQVGANHQQVAITVVP